MSKPKGLSKPQVGERGSKVAAYGQSGRGKTELVMSATKVGHLLLVDAEGRSQYYDADEGHGFEAIYSKNVQDALDLLAYAEELHRKGERVIFAIDGFSSMWFEQQEVAERIGKTSRGTARFDSWGPAKKPLKQLYAKLFQTPVDCIVTMRAKEQYKEDAKGKTVPEKAGYDKPDTERGFPYAVDLVVELRRDELPPGTPLKPENFYAVVIKTSGPKENNPLPIGTRISDPSFVKLMALRLSGNGKHLQIAGADVGLQAALATIKKAGDLKRWITAELGLDDEAVFAALREKFGGWDNAKIPEYIHEVWDVYKNSE